MQFKIEVLSTERLELTIEAANFEEAHDIASATCGSEFSVISGSEGWDILEVTEIEPKKEKMTIYNLLRLDINEPQFSKERFEFYKKNNDVIKKFLLKFVKDLPTTIRKNLLLGNYNKNFKKDTERIEFLKGKVEQKPRKVIEEIIIYEDYDGDIFDDIKDVFEKLM